MAGPRRSAIPIALSGMAIFFGLIACPAVATAANNDVRLLGIGRPATDSLDDPAVERFRLLSTELSAAMSNAGATPASTLGSSGIYFGVVNRFAAISNTKTHWQGTTGYPVLERVESGGDIPGLFWVPTGEFRIGLPFSTELGASVSWLSGSSMFNIGADLKVALHEAYYKGVPDVGLRVGAGRLVGARDLDIINTFADAIISGGIPSRGARWTPHLSLGLLAVHANSQILDATPYEIEDPDDQRGGADGSLYSFPTLEWQDNQHFRLGLGASVEIDTMVVGYEVQATFVKNASALLAHSLKLGLRY